jgi:hypothetical protein
LAEDWVVVVGEVAVVNARADGIEVNGHAPTGPAFSRDVKLLEHGGHDATSLEVKG